MAFRHKDIGQEITKNEWEAVDTHEGVLSVSHIPITSLWLKGLFASRPAASIEGRHYWATDTDEIWRDTGSDWEHVMESVALKAGDYPTAYVGISSSATGRAANLDAKISEVIQQIALTGHPANSVGKILYELYITRLTLARAGNLDQLDFALQEAIAALQTDLDNPGQYKADLSTLETRLSAIRAGYLDQLDFNLQEKLNEIDNEVEGLGGAAMRGTDSAALASVWTAAKAAFLDHSIADLITRTKGLNDIHDDVGAISGGASVLDIWRGLNTEYTPTFGSYSGTSTAWRTILNITSGKGILIGIGASSSVNLNHNVKVTIDGTLRVDRTYFFMTGDGDGYAVFMWGFGTSCLVQMQHSAGYTATYYAIALVE